MPIKRAPGGREENWRTSRHVLVAEASALGQIAVIRSLGRAGYEVHACTSDPQALGLRSRYARHREVHPSYDDPAFLDWLESYVEGAGIAAIVPSESFLHAVRPRFASFAPLMALARQEDIVYRAFSKCDVHAAFRAPGAAAELHHHLPAAVVLREGDPLPGRADLEGLTLPVFVKADAGDGRLGADGLVVRADTVDEALGVIAQVRRTHSSVLVESFVPGSRVVANLCLWNGEVVSRSMMIARHESPHRGGISTLRKVWWNQEIWDDAVRRLHHLKWSGCAMVEYRRDAESGDFHFIEINARYWTGLHTEIFAGIDIPRLQMDAFFGQPSPVPQTPGRPLWCRYTVPGETGYVLSMLKDKALPTRRKLWALAEFVILTFDPRLRADLNFPGDRRLYYLAWWRFLKEAVTAKLRHRPGSRKRAPCATSDIQAAPRPSGRTGRLG